MESNRQFFFQVFLRRKIQTKDKAASVHPSREQREEDSQQVLRHWQEILSKARQLLGFHFFFFHWLWFQIFTYTTSTKEQEYATPHIECWYGGI